MPFKFNPITGELDLVNAATAATNSFATITTPGGTSPVATSPTDTLHLAVTSTSGNLTINGNSATDTVTFSLATVLTDLSGGFSIQRDSRILYGASNFVSVDWGNRQLKNGSSAITVDWVNLRLISPSVSQTIVDWGLALLNDTSGQNSIFFSARQLVDSLGQVTMNWESGFLAYTGITTVDFANGRLSDFATNLCLSWVDRACYDASGSIPSILWDQRQLVDGAGTVAIAWDQRALFDSLGATALDFQNRRLHDTSGIQSGDWTVRGLYDASNLISISWATRTLVNASGNTTLDWSNRQLKDTNGILQLTWNSAGISINQVINNYNGNSTTANGVASIVGNIDLSAQAATISDTTIFTPLAAGMYRASVYVEVTTAGTAGTLAVQIKYSDDNGAQAVDPLPVATLSLAATGFSQGIIVIRSGSATAIKYNTTATGILGSPRYALKIVLERLS